ncbi:MAG: radical SAM protein [Spartobacteria bacterium]|nr:radical SAM protein [Spartobacteria bacterium]
MWMKLIYPEWPKLPNQPEFHLPPHGPVVFAATVPDDVNLTFCDEHVQPLDLNDCPDMVAISCMLSCQVPRGWEIADHYRARGIPVIFGGIATQLHAEETRLHADSIFLGEAEGRTPIVIDDFLKGRLKPVYDYHGDFPDINLVGPARRSILDREAYNYRGTQMVDLVHASRGCRFNCFPCCTPFLGGRQFRPRPFDKVIEELEGINNNRLFIVDNSLAQDDDWERELFRQMIPLRKKWVSHPIREKDDILDLAAEAGCWYVYQAIFDTSDVIRARIKKYKDRGIGVEGTIILGTDDQDEDGIKRLIDFLLEVELDLAEFTVLTPFRHTPIRAQMEAENRILHNDWRRYTAGEAVFEPARMSVEKLNEMFQYAWDTFYYDQTKEVKMAQLYRKVIMREVADGTHNQVRLNKKHWDKKKESVSS